MKLIIDILELYKNVLDIPKSESGGSFDDSAIIQKALGLIGDYFPAYDAELLVNKGRVKYLRFSNEYPSQFPDKITFNIIPAI